jgi:hypothetical protein
VLHGAGGKIDILCGRGHIPFDRTPIPGVGFGRGSPVYPHLPGEDKVDTIVTRHCSRLNPMSSSVVRIEAFDELLTECIASMVVRIYGSFGTQRIIGGQLRVVEEVLDGVC